MSFLSRSRVLVKNAPRVMTSRWMRAVIADHVNLLSGGLRRYHLGEKRDELDTGMAWSSLAQHFAGGDIQGGK